MSAFIRLTGVVEDSDCYNPNVPRNTAKEIAFTRLSDTLIQVAVVHPAGNKVMGGTEAVLTMKSLGDKATELKKTGSVVGNVITFNVAGADTRRFCAGRLAYDVWLTLGGKKYQVIRTAPVRLQDNVTAQP